MKLPVTDKSTVKTVRITTYNAKRKRIEYVKKRIKTDDLRRVKHRKKTHGKYAWTFHVYQFHDRPIEKGDKILAVTVDGTRIDNPHGCAKTDLEYDKKGTVDPKKIDLVPICVDKKHERARYKVSNKNKKPIKVTYSVSSTGKTGMLTVRPKSATYFEVSAPKSDGSTTVTLYYDGETVAKKPPKKNRRCIPRKQFGIEFRCVDPCKKQAKFRVKNNTKSSRTLVYRLLGTKKKGTITIESDGYTEVEDLWVKAPKGKAIVKLYYEGEGVGVAKSDPTTLCDQDLRKDDVTLCWTGFKSDKRDDCCGKRKRATFEVKNHTKQNVGVSWTLNDGKRAKLACIPKKDSKTFSVKLPKDWPKKPLTVVLHYDDHTATATAYPVWNETQESGYTTIQGAIDDADEGDSITVAAGVYEEALLIETDGLTVTGIGKVKPKLFGQVQIDANGVTLKRFRVVYPEDDGAPIDILQADGVTIRNNSVTGGADTGGISTWTGPAQAFGDVRIVGNRITDGPVGLIAGDKSAVLTIRKNKIRGAGDEGLWFWQLAKADLDITKNVVKKAGAHDVKLVDKPLSVNSESDTGDADTIGATICAKNTVKDVFLEYLDTVYECY